MMKLCPKCNSDEIISQLSVRGGEGHPSYVSVIEPDPEKKPFVWIPKSEQSHFRADVCGACGYTEFYAENYKALNEGRKKGYRSQ